MTYEQACKVLTDEEADQIGYMVAPENRQSMMIAAAKRKLGQNPDFPSSPPHTTDMRQLRVKISVRGDVQVSQPSDRTMNLAQQLIHRYGGRAVRIGDLQKTAQQAIWSREAEFTDTTKVNPNREIGYVEIPMAAFDRGGVPNHKVVWPIELDPDMVEGDDLIADGSHRFHSYVRSGIEIVPAIYLLGDD